MLRGADFESRKGAHIPHILDRFYPRYRTRLETLCPWKMSLTKEPRHGGYTWTEGILVSGQFNRRWREDWTAGEFLWKDSRRGPKPSAPARKAAVDPRRILRVSCTWRIHESSLIWSLFGALILDDFTAFVLHRRCHATIGQGSKRVYNLSTTPQLSTYPSLDEKRTLSFSSKSYQISGP